MLRASAGWPGRYACWPSVLMPMPRHATRGRGREAGAASPVASLRTMRRGTRPTLETAEVMHRLVWCESPSHQQTHAARFGVRRIAQTPQFPCGHFAVMLRASQVDRDMPVGLLLVGLL